LVEDARDVVVFICDVVNDRFRRLRIERLQQVGHGHQLSRCRVRDPPLTTHASAHQGAPRFL
jgi:uncharacterized protein (DUF58 family)